jgi:ribosomal subunit interface protein
MRINIKSKDLELTPAIRDFVEEKVNSVEKFVDSLYDGNFVSPSGKVKSPAEAWVEIGKTTHHHKKGQVFMAECIMKFPKHEVVAKAVAQSLESAVTEMKDELQRELKKEKRKVCCTDRRAVGRRK